MMFGQHIIGVIETVDKDILTSKEKLKESILKTCNVCGLNIVSEQYHVFDNPKGITYCFILSKSHFVLHSWPEESKLFFDIFTCGNEKNAEECVKVLAECINGKICSIKTIKI